VEAGHGAGHIRRSTAAWALPRVPLRRPSPAGGRAEVGGQVGGHMRSRHNFRTAQRRFPAPAGQCHKQALTQALHARHALQAEHPPRWSAPALAGPAGCPRCLCTCRGGRAEQCLQCVECGQEACLSKGWAGSMRQAGWQIGRLTGSQPPAAARQSPTSRSCPGPPGAGL
jgi:hypothetical protein